MRERSALCLAGNHDLGVLGELDLSEFAPDAVGAARLDARRARPPSRAATSQALRPQASASGRELFHASPRDPVWDYVLTLDAVARLRSS